MWYETDKHELVLGQMLCLEGSEKLPRLGKCHEMGGTQEWKHNGLVSMNTHTHTHTQNNNNNN
jgi:hypothetical protein